MAKIKTMKRLLLFSLILLLAPQCGTPHDHNECCHHHNTSPLTIGFVGDMMLGRLVSEEIKKTGPSSLVQSSEGRVCQHIWGTTLPLLQNNDINIGNLETTLTRSNKIVPKVFNFKSDPDNVCALVAGNFTVVNLANNHTLDFSDEGLLETISILNKAGIKHVGAGKSQKAARAPVIIKKHGVKVGIIGYTDNEPGWIAQENKRGTNYIRVGDVARVRADIQALRPKVDILIVTLQWGPNMRQRPTQEYIDFAHVMIESGADIIHGHSAHIFQGIEIYQGKLIMYDTGDFIDDYAIDAKLRNDRSFLFQVTIADKKIESMHLVPLIIQNMQVNVAEDREAQEILKHMQQLSAEFGTTISNDGFIRF
jgi:poly-gamma-glutamate capsule biosynthesis protein CapA/YwtB (metallophosphatase superfamily)